MERGRYPAEHWVHLRTTNPIESTFATVRHRTKVTKGPGSRAAGLATAFKGGELTNLLHAFALVGVMRDSNACHQVGLGDVYHANPLNNFQRPFGAPGIHRRSCRRWGVGGCPRDLRKKEMRTRVLVATVRGS